MQETESRGAGEDLDVDLTICWLISSRMEWIMYNGNAEVLAAVTASDVVVVGVRLLYSSSVAPRAKAGAKVILERGEKRRRREGRRRCRNCFIVWRRCQVETEN